MAVATSGGGSYTCELSREGKRPSPYLLATFQWALQAVSRHVRWGDIRRGSGQGLGVTGKPLTGDTGATHLQVEVPQVGGQPVQRPWGGGWPVCVSGPWRV